MTGLVAPRHLDLDFEGQAHDTGAASRTDGQGGDMSELRRIPAGSTVVACCHILLRGYNPKVHVFNMRNGAFDQVRQMDEGQKADYVMICPPCHHRAMNGGDMTEGAPWRTKVLTREVSLPG